MATKRIFALAVLVVFLLSVIVMPCYAVYGSMDSIASTDGSFTGVYKLQNWSSYTSYIYSTSAGRFVPLPSYNTIWYDSVNRSGWTMTATAITVDNSIKNGYTYPVYENESFDSVTGEQSLFLTYRPSLVFNPNESEGEYGITLYEGMFYTRKVAERTYNGFRFEVPSDGVTDCNIAWAGRVYWRDSSITDSFSSQNTEGTLEFPAAGQVGIDVTLSSIEDFDETYDDVIFVGTLVVEYDVSGGYIGVTNYYTRGANAETISLDVDTDSLVSSNYQGAPKVVELLMEDARNTAGGINPSGNLNITQNGSYNVRYYDTVSVNVPTEVIEGEFPNLLDWLVDTGEAFLDFQIAPGWRLSSILTFIVIIGLVVWVVRLFMGG